MALLAAVAVAGCATKPEVSTRPPISEPAVPERTVLGPGDDVEVLFYYTPQLNLRQRIRPDGRIALLLVGDVEAVSKTPGELRDELMALYEPHLREPEISVVVREQVEQRVYVGGEVKRPGMVEMHGPLTALEAIMQASGFDLRQGDVGNVIVIRHEYSGRYGFKLDFEGTLEGAESQPFYLRPRDIVYVSRTPIADVNQWVEQYIDGIIPRSLWLRWPVGSGEIGSRGGR